MFRPVRNVNATRGWSIWLAIPFVGGCAIAIYPQRGLCELIRVCGYLTIDSQRASHLSTSSSRRCLTVKLLLMAAQQYL